MKRKRPQKPLICPPQIHPQKNVGEIDGKLVNLRPLALENVRQNHIWLNDPEIRKYLENNELIIVKRKIKLPTYENEDNFAIYLKNGIYIGTISLVNIDTKNSSATVGLFIWKDYWGKGYGTDAIKTLLKYTFCEMNLNRVSASTLDYNERALAIIKKSGFKIEGRQREFIFRNGRYVDIILFGLLKKDYEGKFQKQRNIKKIE
jgi:RimJ/RimL family protein N-acetyltransferase